MFAKRQILLIAVMIASGCAYEAKPVIPHYTENTTPRINGPVTISIGGSLASLTAPVANNAATTCKAHSFSVNAQAGFVEAVERFISGAFSPAASGSVESPYKVEVLVDRFEWKLKICKKLLLQIFSF